jgi:hypothetical protein
MKITFVEGMSGAEACCEVAVEVELILFGFRAKKTTFGRHRLLHSTVQYRTQIFMNIF